VLFELTDKQRQQLALLKGDATNILGYGGARSAKTFGFTRIVVVRALAAPRSRHAILRYRFNHVKQSVVMDTFPAVMDKAFPGVPYHVDRTDWFATLGDGSEIWFGGLDDKERTEKILGKEYATIFFNECSQIPYASRNLAMTRLSQRVDVKLEGDEPKPLRLKALYDENPPSQAHWTYKLFVRKVDPDNGKPLTNPEDYACIQMNPKDNEANIAKGYIEQILERQPARMRLRFLEGKFADITEGALWTIEIIERQRETDIELPDMQRIIVAVDPSGSDGDADSTSDDIGIIVVGLGVDGRAYVLEDLSCNASPDVWGKLVTNAFDRHEADLIVGEANFGGDMVRFVVQTSKPRVPFKKVIASRGKVVRAEPISALTEQGKIRFAGSFPQLEDELCGFTTHGYIGVGSPNRADAMVWGMTELFPGMVKEERKRVAVARPATPSQHDGTAWLGL
jgi:predicted phage terminase large subunit-like protein